MPRAGARVTQAEIARAVRAARSEGVTVVEIVEGRIRLVLVADQSGDVTTMVKPSPAGEKPKVVL